MWMSYYMYVTECFPTSVLLRGASSDPSHPTSVLRSRSMYFDARIISECHGPYTGVMLPCWPTWYADSMNSRAPAIILPSKSLILILPSRLLPYSVYKITISVVSLSTSHVYHTWGVLCVWRFIVFIVFHISLYRATIMYVAYYCVFHVF